VRLNGEYENIANWYKNTPTPWTQYPASKLAPTRPFEILKGGEKTCKRLNWQDDIHKEVDPTKIIIISSN